VTGIKADQRGRLREHEHSASLPSCKIAAPGNRIGMPSRRELPADVAAAFDRVPEARDRFAAMPAERQIEWLKWIDRGRGRRGRAARIDEAIRRLLPSATAAQEEVAEPVGPPPERYWWVWLVLLLVLVVGGLLAWWLLTRGDDKSTVPNVIGLRAQAAATRIRDRDLEVLPRTGQSNRPQGVVFAQKPGAGTQLDEGQTVTISISSGRLAVPDVTGLPLNDAKRELRSAGFENDVKRVASSRPKGIVVEQAPVAGVTAVRGTTVELNVSSGVRPVVVPRVVGQTQGAAVTTLTRLGLKPVLRNVPSAQPVGIAVAQNPPAGKEADKGSPVTVNVSTGRAASTTTVATTTTTTATTVTTTAGRIRVPRVVGLAQTRALRRLNAAQFRPTVVYVRSSQPANRVLRQVPAPGASLQRGSRVRIDVSTGPNPEPAATVPNVIGQDRATAVSTLRSAGFRVLVLDRPASNQSQNGIVIDEQPRPGRRIPGGLQVTIFVGRTG
jgi:beta-lactam-binding protein with PASTA domain